MATTSVFTMAALCLEYLSASGYSISDEVITTDLADKIESMPERAEITPVLSPWRNDFNSQNSFWLLLRKDGVLVGTLGARFDGVYDKHISQHISDLHSRHYPSERVPSLVPNAPDQSNDISGGIVYMGDVFFSKGHRGDIGKTQCFCQYAFCLAYAKWWDRADWIVALHRKVDLNAGKREHYGFISKSIPAVQTWKSVVENRSNDEVLSSLSKPDFLRNIGNFIEDPLSLVDPPVRPR